MELYTYCTYKGAAKGYQYASIKKDNRENLSGSEPESSMKEWFEDKSGWKMVLERNENKAYLLVKSLEDFIKIENQQKQDRYEEKKQANEFKAIKESIQIEEIKQPQTYINFAIAGELNQIFNIAIGVLADFRRDCGRDIYAKIEACISHPDVSCYLVDGERMYSVLGDLSNAGNSLLKDLKRSANERHFNIWDKIKVVKRLNPSIERLTGVRNEKMTDLLQGIPKPKEFTENHMIYVAEENQIRKYGTYNIALSYMDYLIKGIKL